MLAADDLRVVKWYVDASFAVHPDFMSHTGGVMTFGDGAIQSVLRKQKLNMCSITEAELVGADDVATMILWTKLFLGDQGYHVEKVFSTNIPTNTLQLGDATVTIYGNRPGKINY